MSSELTGFFESRASLADITPNRECPQYVPSSVAYSGTLRLAFPGFPEHYEIGRGSSA